FWVLYGDSYMDINYAGVYRTFDQSNTLGLMTVIRNDNQWDRSNAVFDAGKLLCYDKRNRKPEMQHVDYGASLFRRAAIGKIPENAPFDLADLMHDLVKTGEMMGVEVHQRFYEIGSHQGLQETAAYLASRTAVNVQDTLKC